MRNRRIGDCFSLHLPHLMILRSAALLVPRPQRTEWLAEWSAELWYVLQQCNHLDRRSS
jgi:hypothetical protein